MATSEETRHNLLLIIATGLFILFSTGLAAPAEIPEQPIIIPG